MRVVKIIILSILALAVATSAGTYIYINYISDEAPTAFTESTRATTAPAANTAPISDVTGTWAVTTGSQVGYRVKEVLFGQDTEGVGRTNSVTGELTAENLTISAASFTVDMASVTSDSDRRDSQFTGRIMETAQFPTASFTLTSPITLPSAPSGTSYTVTATGDLNLHGVTKSVTTDLTVQANGANVVITGGIPVLFSDYNIDNPSFSGVTTEDNGTLELSLVFAKG